jgi:hypothetical protein
VEIPRARHAVMALEFRRLELRLLVDVGGVHLEIFSEALFFDEADQIFGTLGVASVLFQVPAPKTIVKFRFNFLEMKTAPVHRLQAFHPNLPVLQQVQSPFLHWKLHFAGEP